MCNRNDPRYDEIFDVMRTAHEAHPGYNSSDPILGYMSVTHGLRAVIEHVESTHHDLYKIIQTFQS